MLNWKHVLFRNIPIEDIFAFWRWFALLWWCTFVGHYNLDTNNGQRLTQFTDGTLSNKHKSILSNYQNITECSASSDGPISTGQIVIALRCDSLSRTTQRVWPAPLPPTFHTSRTYRNMLRVSISGVSFLILLFLSKHANRVERCYLLRAMFARSFDADGHKPHKYEYFANHTQFV